MEKKWILLIAILIFLIFTFLFWRLTSGYAKKGYGKKCGNMGQPDYHIGKLQYYMVQDLQL